MSINDNFKKLLPTSLFDLQENRDSNSTNPAIPNNNTNVNTNQTTKEDLLFYNAISENLGSFNAEYNPDTKSTSKNLVDNVIQYKNEIDNYEFEPLYRQMVNNIIKYNAYDINNITLEIENLKNLILNFKEFENRCLEGSAGNEDCPYIKTDGISDGSIIFKLINDTYNVLVVRSSNILKLKELYIDPKYIITEDNKSIIDIIESKIANVNISLANLKEEINQIESNNRFISKDEIYTDDRINQNFIDKLIPSLNDKYLTYADKEEIMTLISDCYKNIENNLKIMNNHLNASNIHTTKEYKETVDYKISDIYKRLNLLQGENLMSTMKSNANYTSTEDINKLF